MNPTLPSYRGNSVGPVTVGSIYSLCGPLPSDKMSPTALDITANTSAVALPTTPQAPTAAQHLGIANSTMGRVPFTQLSRSASEHLTPASEQSTPGKRKLNPQSASFSPLADRLKDPKAQVEQSAPLFVTPKKATITLTPAVSERRSNAAPVSKFEAAPPSQVLPSAAAMPSGQATEKEGSTRAKPTIPPQLRPATPRPKPTSPKPSIAKAPIIARADAAESFNTTKLTEPTTSSKTEGAMPQPGQTVQKPDDQDGMMQRWFDQQLQTKTPDPTIVQLMAVQNDVKTSNLKPGKLIDFGDSPEAKSPPSPIRKPPVASSSNQGSRPPPFKTSSSTSLPKWNEAPVTNSKEGKENAPLVPFSPTPSLRPRPQIRAPSPQKFAERKLETFLSSDNALQPTTTDHTTLTPNRNTSTSPAHESPAAFLKAVASHLSTFSTKWSTPTKPHTDTPPRSPSPTPSSSLEEGEIRPSSSPASSSLKKVKSRSTDKDKDYHHPKPLFSYDDEPELLSSASYTDDPPPPAPKEEKEEQEKPPRKTSEGNRLTAASFEGNGDGRLIMRSGNWEPLGGRGAEPTGTRELGEEMDDESYAMVVRKQDRRRTAALERKLMWRKAVRRTSLGMDGYRWVLPRGFRME